MFSEWLTLSVYGCAFIGSATWWKRRSFGSLLLALAGSGSVLSVLGTARPPLHGPTLLIALISGAVIGVSLFRGYFPVRTPTLKGSAPAAVRTELNWARTVGGVVFLIAGLSLCVEAGRGPGAGSAVALAMLFLAAGAFLLPGPLPRRIVGTAALAATAVVFGHGVVEGI